MEIDYKIKQHIQKDEINSFLKYWKHNTNEIVNIGGVDIHQNHLMLHYIDLLNSFCKDKRFKIFGVDKCKNFEMGLCTFDDLANTCLNMWKNPELYYQTDRISKNDDGSGWYYEFLKFIYVEFGDIELNIGEFVDRIKEPNKRSTIEKMLNLS